MRDPGESDGYVISPSKPIPLAGTDEDEDPQPPHRQAAEYYLQDVLNDRRHLLVTMSEPSSTSPKPVVIAITRDGAVKIPHGSGGSGGGGGTKVAAAVVAPRAG